MMDWADEAAGAMLWFLLLFIALFLLVMAVEAVQWQRSFDKQVACEVKLMQPRRRVLTTSVVCIPVPQRQDTSTIRVRP